MNLEHYLRAGYAGLNLVTHEEARVRAELQRVAAATGSALYHWSVTDGLFLIAQPEPNLGCQDPMDFLDAFMRQLPEKSLVIANDFHLFLKDPNPVLVRKLKDALALGKATQRVIAIVGCQLHLPPELEKLLTVIEYALPDRAELEVVLRNVASSASLTVNGNLDALLDAASGLTTMEAEDAFALSVVEAGNLMPDIVARIKASTIKKSGILEILEPNADMDRIGGLANLKTWLGRRRLAFGREAAAYGLPTPKGYLMAGIPGCGKSLTAKATAKILGLPLLKLDGGRIFGSLVGESERNLRSALQTAEAIAPCVLFIDEFEKAFAGSASSGATDGGCTARVLGTFLQWMQDKTKPVFVVATANNVSALPPELLRKGRFDEQWFIDLPDLAERTEIWRIQIARHGRKPEAFDLDALAAASTEWTGSEIEACFSEALFTAYDQERSEPDTELLLRLAKDLVPLARMMSGDIEAIRKWAAGRARRASANPSDKANRPSGRKVMKLPPACSN
jgi:SpoVK/Ycf46/Vps4 family AAA+-type ATPase